METTVLLVDDHPLFRQGLRLLIERDAGMRVVGEAGDGQQAIDLARELSPDVVVMDITMPDVNGIEATQRILAASPGTKVVALSIHGEKRFVEDMLLAGARGYILKESAPEDVVNGIRAVTRGEVYLSAGITKVVVSGYKERLSGDPSAAKQVGKTSATPTVLTKLHRPRISQRVVSRPRLLGLLEAGRRRPLTLVSAPAGYGKSTLVSQWLESIESECPSAWLSLDGRDNDVRVFMTHLVAAVQTQFPEALQGTSLLVNAPALPPLPVLAGTLVNEVALVPRRFILVLDDYHRIVEPSIHELLSELLRHPPKTLHLVLVTRRTLLSTCCNCEPTGRWVRCAPRS